MSKPPALPMHDGRWRDDHEFAFGDLAESPVEFVHDGVLVQFGAAFRPAFKDHEAVTALGRAAPSSMEKPLMVTHVSTPGVLANTSSIRLANSEVRGAGRGVGQLRAHKDIPLILFGQEALRQSSQPPDGKGGEGRRTSAGRWRASAG